MQEADIEPGGPFANASRRETHSLRRQPLHGCWQIVYPKTDVIQRCGVNRRLPVWVDRLHQIDFNPHRTCTDGTDVFVDVLALRDCHNVGGAGKDVSSVGKAVTKTANDVKN